MTLSVRNSIFRGGIILAVISLAIIAAGGYYAFSAIPEVSAAAAQRSQGLINIIIKETGEPSEYVPFWTMLGLAAYSLVSIILIYYFFEKTQSPEILFLCFFVISLSFEFIRILLPLRRIFPFPDMYLITASRILLFGRNFGLLSLFAASVFAAGLDMQRQQSVLIMLILASMVIALNIPIDSLVWDSTFVLWNGYNTMLKIAGTGILGITIITFFISAHTRGSKSYITIGIGTFLVFLGRNISFCSDNWVTLVPGFILLVLGTWLVCSRLHREYLWL